MSKQTNIEWCHSTFNFWEGCTKIGPGCDNCYAEARNLRFHAGANWGPGAPRLLRSDAYWREPLKWERDHAQFFTENGCRRRVFANSLSDIFDNEAPEGQRERAWELIRATPNLNWLLLTKRIGNAKNMLPDDWGDGYDNVWLGSSIVNQQEADRDIPKLLHTPANIHFLSMGPLLGPVDLERPMPGPDLDQGGGAKICQPWLIQSGIRWVIVEGESGPGGRPMHPDWARSLRDQCAAASVPFLFKQWGEWREPEVGQPFNTSMGRAQRVPAFIVAPRGTVHCFENEPTTTRGKVMLRVGKKTAGRLLDGAIHDGYPEGIAN